MKKNFSAWSKANKNPQPKNLNEALIFAISYAILAPSAHNTQPWLFKINDNEITISLDERYTIGSSDPNNMLAYMSLGCAKAYLEVAFERMGVDYSAEDLKITALSLNTPKTSKEFDAIFERHSNRFVFSEKKVNDTEIQEMKSVINNDSNFYFLTNETRIKELADITAEATEKAYANKEFRTELAHYLRNNLTFKNDGMPGYVVDAPTPLSFFASIVVRNFNIGKQERHQVEKLFHNTSLILVATSTSDSINAWLTVGEKLAKILLRAQSLGLQAGWFAAPIVIDDYFRNKVKNILPTTNLPQMLLRIGHPTKIQPPTPRKPISSVIKP